MSTYRVVRDQPDLDRSDSTDGPEADRNTADGGCTCQVAGQRKWPSLHADNDSGPAGSPEAERTSAI